MILNLIFTINLLFILLLLLSSTSGQQDPLVGHLHPGVAELGQLRHHPGQLVPETAVLQHTVHRCCIPAHLVNIGVEKLVIHSPLYLGGTL